jgi:hypothetical protein
MRPEAAARRALSYTRAKAKMYEYGVPLEDHIRLLTDPKDLLAFAVGVVGDAAAEVVTERFEGQSHRATPSDVVLFAATFFDAFVDAQLEDSVRDELILLAAAAYYLADMPGNARLLVGRISEPDAVGAERLDWLVYRLLKADLQTEYEDHAASTLTAGILDATRAFFTMTEHEGPLENLVSFARHEAYAEGAPRTLFYADLAAALIARKIQNASRTVLPTASGLPLEVWLETLSKPGFMSELWPAQHRICDAGVLAGRSVIIQMPTSAGKTRATELIIRSAFLAGRTDLAVIVSPFKALCHDIRADLAKAFQGENIGINEATDSFALDLSFDDLWERKTVLILTPEKLLYLLRRSPELADQIGLIVYDEGHQFDSPGRGATYELLLTSLKILLNSATQTVLISAVIANAAEVADWLVGDLDAVVAGHGLSPTSRHIAFATWATSLGQLRYVPPSDPDDIDFFVPRVIEPTNLRLIGNGTSVGLYLGLKLARNGSVAVFCGRKDTAANLCEKAVEVFSRGYAGDRPLTFSNPEEVTKIAQLFAQHLGSSAPATMAAALGIFPHHANVPHGLRLSIEHAMKEGLARFVVCTSTLAQGVNLPIKYLIVTGVYQGGDRMLTRDFHNLIGRVGRAGMHTEGSVIFSQTSVYDGKDSREEGWRWQLAKDMLNPANSEPSASSILLLFEPFRYGRPVQTITIDVATAHGLVFDERQRVQAFLAQFTLPKADMDGLRRYLNVRTRIVQAIASYLLAHLDFEAGDLLADAERLCTNTLAYHLATDEQRIALIGLFQNIANFAVSEAPTEELRTAIRRSGLSPTSVRALAAWLVENLDRIRDAAANDAIFEVLAGQILAHSGNDALLSFSESDAVVGLAAHWLSGASFAELHKYLSDAGVRLGKRRPNINDVVGLCEGGFGYDAAMLISTIADLIEVEDEDLAEQVGQVHKRLKNGLPSLAAIAFYEVGFADRVVAMRLADVAPNVRDRFAVVAAIRLQTVEIEEALRQFPIFFTEVMREIVRG